MTTKKEKHYVHASFIDVLFRHGGKISGWFAVLILGLIALIRAKPDDIPKVFESIFITEIFCYLGWIVAVLILLCSLFVAYLIWKIYPKELERVCKERDRLQEILLDRDIRHSGRKE